MSTSGGVGGQQWQRVTVPTDSASWDVGTPAFVLADAAVTLPLTITTGVNDTFNYTPNGGAAELFTMAPHVALATLAAVIAAMAAATGAVSGEAFSTKYTPSNGGAGKILITAIAKGVTGNGDTITEGNAGAAALGFTANPDTVAGGVGQLGTVTFNGDGTITVGPVSAIASIADEWGVAWAVQATVLMAALSGPVFGAGYDLTALGPVNPQNNSLGTAFNLTAGAPGTLTPSMGQGSANYNPAVAVGFHTCKVVGTVPLAAAYFDGVLQGAPALNNSFETTFSSRFFLGNNYNNPVTFSALKAWRIPIPTLS